MMRCIGCSALFVGVILFLSSLFFVTGSASEVPIPLDVLLCSAYLMVCISLMFAGAGLRWKNNDEIHQMCRQVAKASFLMGLTVGIFSEMMCNGSDRKLSVNLRRSCGLLGASSGLILFGLLALQSNTTVPVFICESDDTTSDESEPAMEDFLAMEDFSAASPPLAENKNLSRRNVFNLPALGWRTRQGCDWNFNFRFPLLCKWTHLPQLGRRLLI